MTRLLILIAFAFVIASATLGWMLREYLPGATLADIFFGMTPVLKLLALAILVLAGVGAVGGLMRNVERVHKVTILTVALGALGAAYGELNTQLGTLDSNPVTFATMAPGRIDSLAILALGLFGALLGLGILQLRRGPV
ncbi:hypothetical protein [Brevundimonas subvibrioides]|uniref:hypothetical protein n=1 Tax=Brevundimonas subvibrioides TaxID=74313 RepID=UPI0022B5C442|nr:hypothetical protein [Brevundimonas subvibrioides]